jgi:predicted TIM-barrel fold metal-dependent hydrolase
MLTEIPTSARLPNICVKMSGFAYVSQVKWDYPYPDTMRVVRALYEHYGPHRLCWGSDYPVVRFYMTYQHALEAFRTHCPFIPEGDKRLILGETLDRLLTP